ncbi:MAG: hypothetical protein H6610_04170 [Ignavibacteriales bacterium]|nr:hypothetical protein [Ignavibacteriales bacterium]MCB9209974.1 hypothetical protein [Ignavibacteriales bacterium]MCB9218641.1 hypothetical protein [Ignavibacteriales bacterium]MCB9259353.1 hypothetical protein [Ignavibacteriales bacterium]
MVIVFIFLMHVIFIIYVFVKKLKKESLSSALIDLALIIILFSVGWSLTTMLAKLIWEPIGFGKHFDRDTIALTILTIVEYFFYKIYYKGFFSTASGKGK